MPMTIYKLYASTAGDSVASLDIQMDGEIMSMLATITATGCDALNDGVQGEVSFLSSPGFTVNDLRGSLLTLQSQLGFLTQGGGNMGQNVNMSNLEIPVAAGERVHMHISDIGAPTGRAMHCYLYVRDKGTPRVPGRRR